jgi:superfamily II DNA/RNA helicase
MQSHQVIEEIGNINSVCVYGGVSKQAQIRELRQKHDVVVATPGRLLDLVSENSISLRGM